MRVVPLGGWLRLPGGGIVAWKVIGRELAVLWYAFGASAGGAGGGLEFPFWMLSAECG